jgi:hypothetical protein
MTVWLHMLIYFSNVEASNMVGVEIMDYWRYAELGVCQRALHMLLLLPVRILRQFLDIWLPQYCFPLLYISAYVGTRRLTITCLLSTAHGKVAHCVAYLISFS